MKKYCVLILIFGGVFATTVAAQLPSVLLKDIKGKTVDTQTLSNDGKPMIISFFATWCKPCHRELAAIHEVYADWVEETGVKLVAVSIDEGQNALKVAPEVKAKGWEFEVLLDPNGDFKRALGVNLIPAVFLLDGSGKIVLTRTSYKNGEEEELIEMVRKLLK